MRQRLLFCFVSLMAIIPSSCGNDGRLKVYPLKGQLFVDEKPAAKAFVYIHLTEGSNPSGVRPYAQVDDNGTFAFSTYVQGDGVPTGDYILTFEWKEASGIMKNNYEGPDRLKGRFTDPKKSTQKVSVGKEPKDLGRIDLSLKK